MTAHAITAETIAATVARLRERRPRVHCITNSAAVNYTANVLLAAGCIPSMTVNPEEVPAFVADCSARKASFSAATASRRNATFSMASARPICSTMPTSGTRQPTARRASPNAQAIAKIARSPTPV